MKPDLQPLHISVKTRPARALVRIVGADSAKVMSKLCGIDFGDKVTPDGSVLRASVAGLVAEVIRSDLANRPGGAADSDVVSRSYLLLCEHSARQYLFNVLLAAGEELWHGCRGLRNQRSVILFGRPGAKIYLFSVACG